MTPELVKECREYLDAIRSSDHHRLSRAALARVLIAVEALTQSEAEGVVDQWALDNEVELK